ncbi:hypothetical protein MRX96_024378 [Rhipicephalus microplus]
MRSSSQKKGRAPSWARPLQEEPPRTHPPSRVVRIKVLDEELSSGLDIVSLAGEWLSATANTNMFTYEIAPVFILMENVVMKKMRDLIGYTNGDSILAPGGSVSNLYAVMAARHKMFPSYKTLGLKALPQLVMYTSEDSHYSVKGAGASIGLGTDNVVSIPVDKVSSLGGCLSHIRRSVARYKPTTADWNGSREHADAPIWRLEQ